MPQDRPKALSFATCKGLVVVLDPDHGGDRAEHLLAVDPHLVGGVGDQGRLQVVALGLARQPLAAERQLAAFLPADLEIAQVLVELLLVDHRPDLGAGLERMVDLELLHAFDHRRDEAVVDGLGDDQARGRGAALPGLEEGAVERAAHRDVEIGVVQHHERVLAAHLELELGEARRAFLRDVPAGIDRAREAHGGDVRRLEDRLADHRAAAHHQVEHALGHARALEDVGERPGAAGHQVGGLEDHGVAVGERRRDLPGRDREREVPGRDQADHAERLAGHVDLDARPDRGHALARKAQRLAGEELEDLAGAARLADAVGERLALLAREQLAELLPALEDLVADGVEKIEALLRRAPGPGRKRRLGRGDRLLGKRPIGARVDAHDVAQIGRIEIVLGLGALDPRPADQMRFQCHRLAPPLPGFWVPNRPRRPRPALPRSSGAPKATAAGARCHPLAHGVAPYGPGHPDQG